MSKPFVGQLRNLKTFSHTGTTRKSEHLIVALHLVSSHLTSASSSVKHLVLSECCMSGVDADGRGQRSSVPSSLLGELAGSPPLVDTLVSLDISGGCAPTRLLTALMYLRPSLFEQVKFFTDLPSRPPFIRATCRQRAWYCRAQHPLHGHTQRTQSLEHQALAQPH